MEEKKIQFLVPGKLQSFGRENAPTMRTVPLVPEKDQYFDAFRHLPLWKVSTLVPDAIREWKQKDAALRERMSDAPGPRRGAPKVAAVNTVQALPEHKGRFTLLDNHSDICERCNRWSIDGGLIDVAALMNDLGCCLDRDGNIND